MYMVASFAEAWIEILPGMPHILWRIAVASFAEAWIEIRLDDIRFTVKRVASFAEAWIEIDLPSGARKA